MTNENVFSDSWHKISNLRISLLNSVSVQKQKFRDEELFVIKEPYNNKYFKLTKEAYFFVSRLTLDKTVQEVIDEIIEEDSKNAPSQNEIIELVSSLHSHNLLYFKNLAENDFIFERHKEKKYKEHKGKLYSFLFFKVPLLNPNSLLDKAKNINDIIFSKFGLVVWLIVCLLGLKAVIDNIETIFDQAQGMLAPSNLILLYISLALMKLFHELAHSGMIKKFGGSVNTLGIMFLVLTPLPYMDATHSWFFKDKYQKVIVSFAGMMSDLFFAAIATIIWANTGDGIINSISFNIMIIGSVSSLLFNGNPLLRFDAYYMLSDYLEIPNLFQKSKEYFYYLFEKHIFKVETSQNPSGSKRESFWLFTYAVVSYLYRIIIALGIIIYVADQLLIVGIIMAILTFFMWVFTPLKKFIQYLINSPKLYKTRGRALLISSVIFSIVIISIFYIPISNSIKAPGVIESKDSVIVYAKTEGLVEKVLIKNGDYVKKGQTIAILKNKDLEYDIASLNHSLKQIEIVKQKFLSQSSINLKALNEKKNVLKEKLDYLLNKQDLLKIKAQDSGTFVSNRIDSLVYTWLKKQSEIGTIVKSKDLNFFAVINQEEAYELFDKDKQLTASVKFFGQGEKEFYLENVRLIPFARNQLPSAALGWFGGGDISVSSEDSDGKKTTEFFFEISGTFILNEKDKHIIKEGRTGVLKVELEKSSLGRQIYIKINQLLQKRYKI